MTQADQMVVAGDVVRHVDQPDTLVRLDAAAGSVWHGTVTASASSRLIGASVVVPLNLGTNWSLVPRKPLTVGDIPAGQGAASLYLTKAGDKRILSYRALDGSCAYLETEPNHQERFGYTANASAALWEHLAATLRHVTTEETP